MHGSSKDVFNKKLGSKDIARSKSFILNTENVLPTVPSEKNNFLFNSKEISSSSLSKTNLDIHNSSLIQEDVKRKRGNNILSRLGVPEITVKQSNVKENTFLMKNLNISNVNVDIKQQKKEIQLDQLMDRFMVTNDVGCNYKDLDQFSVATDEVGNKRFQVGRDVLLTLLRKVQKREQDEFEERERFEAEKILFQVEQEKLKKATELLEQQRIALIPVEIVTKPVVVDNSLPKRLSFANMVNMKVNDSAIFSNNLENNSINLKFSHLTRKASKEIIPSVNVFDNYYDKHLNRSNLDESSDLFKMNKNLVKPNFVPVKWLDYTSKLDSDADVVSKMGWCFANLCGRITKGDLAADCLFVIISRTNLVAGLPIDNVKWDDLQTNHIVALYKCIKVVAASKPLVFKYIFVAYLWCPSDTLINDLHEEGTSWVSEVPNKLYVPKALSTLRKMCANVESLDSVLSAKFVHPNRLCASFKDYLWKRGVDEAEKGLVETMQGSQSSMRICDEIPSRKDDIDYQGQINLMKQQMLANRLSIETILTESKLHKEKMQISQFKLCTVPTPIVHTAQVVDNFNNINNHNLNSSSNFNSDRNVKRNRAELFFDSDNFNENTTCNKQGKEDLNFPNMTLENSISNNFKNNNNFNNSDGVLNENAKNMLSMAIDLSENVKSPSTLFENGKEKLNLDSRTFFDANNNPYVSSTNGAQIQELVDNHFVLSR
jgi:hypothetical protein